MKKLALLAALIGFQFGVVIVAAEPPTTAAKQQPTTGIAAPSALSAEAYLATLQDPPIVQRKLNFHHSIEKHPLVLYAADPKLLEQKYVAIVQLRILPHEAAWVKLSQKISQQFYFRGRSLIKNSSSSRGRAIGGFPSPEEMTATYFQNLVKSIPKDRLPPGELLSFFTTKQPPLYLGYHPKVSDIRTFSILAPTQKRAEALAGTLIYLLDNGLMRPAQIEIPQQLKEWRQLQQSREEEKGALQTKLTETEQTLKQQFGNFDEITVAGLVDLSTQRRLLSVDLAGIEARINACNKILTERNKLPTGRIDQVETIKITAEIEMVGLTAQLETIGKIVDRGRQYNELKRSRDIFRNNRVQLDRRINSDAERINKMISYARLYEAFPLVDDKITIHPIQWQAAGEGGD